MLGWILAGLSARDWTLVGRGGTNETSLEADRHQDCATVYSPLDEDKDDDDDEKQEWRSSS